MIVSHPLTFIALHSSPTDRAHRRALIRFHRKILVYLRHRHTQPPTSTPLPFHFPYFPLLGVSSNVLSFHIFEGIDQYPIALIIIHVTLIIFWIIKPAWMINKLNSLWNTKFNNKMWRASAGDDVQAVHCYIITSCP